MKRWLIFIFLLALNYAGISTGVGQANGLSYFESSGLVVSVNQTDLAKTLAYASQAMFGQRVQVCDGVNDHLGASISANYSSGKVKFTDGKFYFSDNASISKNGLKLIGEGANTEIVLTQPGISGFDITGHDTDVSDMTITANVPKTAGAGIVLRGVNGQVRFTHINNVRIMNQYRALDARDYFGLYLDHFWALDCKYGIKSSGYANGFFFESVWLEPYYTASYGTIGFEIIDYLEGIYGTNYVIDRYNDGFVARVTRPSESISQIFLTNGFVDYGSGDAFVLDGSDSSQGNIFHVDINGLWVSDYNRAFSLYDIEDLTVRADIAHIKTSAIVMLGKVQAFKLVDSSLTAIGTEQPDQYDAIFTAGTGNSFSIDNVDFRRQQAFHSWTATPYRWLCVDPGTADNSSLTNSRFYEPGGHGYIYDGVGRDALLIRDNMGLVTEKNGVAVIPTGETSVTVTHGLGFTPIQGDIMVGLGLRSDNFTASTFTIFRDTPAPNDIVVPWQASRN